MIRNLSHTPGLMIQLAYVRLLSTRGGSDSGGDSIADGSGGATVGWLYRLLGFCRFNSAMRKKRQREQSARVCVHP